MPATVTISLSDARGIRAEVRLTDVASVDEMLSKATATVRAQFAVAQELSAHPPHVLNRRDEL